MKDTKVKILGCALEHFNERGVSETTLRMVASALDISQGNLNYHFRTKQELVEALYFELVDKMDLQIQNLVAGKPDLRYLYDVSGISMGVLFEYKFLLKDSLKVMRMSSKIKAHYHQLQKKRLAQFMELFRQQEANGTIRAQQFEAEYERLYERLTILGDNWIRHQEMQRPELQDPVRYYQRLNFEIIYPYLTEEGKSEFGKLWRR